MKNKDTILEYIETLDSLPELGSEDYSERINELMQELSMFKKTLQRGPHRKNNRKEAANLQRAIEALRYLRKKHNKVIEAQEQIINEVSALQLGNFRAITPCDGTEALNIIFGDDEELSNNLNFLIKGFIPYYVCQGANFLAREFITRLADPLEEFYDALVLYKKTNPKFAKLGTCKAIRTKLDRIVTTNLANPVDFRSMFSDLLYPYQSQENIDVEFSQSMMLSKQQVNAKLSDATTEAQRSEKNLDKFIKKTPVFDDKNKAEFDNPIMGLTKNDLIKVSEYRQTLINNAVNGLIDQLNKHMINPESNDPCNFKRYKI